MYSLSLFLISLRCLIECPVIIILHNVFSVCFAKPFRQAFSINIVRNKVLAGDQHRMVSYLYLSKPLEISANMPGLGGTGFERYSSSENQICNFNHGPTFHAICKVHHGSVQCCILLQEPTIKLVTIYAAT